MPAVKQEPVEEHATGAEALQNSAAVASHLPQHPGSKLCTQCQKYTDDVGARFCQHCGCSFREPSGASGEQVVVCCGKTRSTRFCTDCGKKLTAGISISQYRIWFLNPLISEIVKMKIEIIISAPPFLCRKTRKIIFAVPYFRFKCIRELRNRHL